MFLKTINRISDFKEDLLNLSQDDIRAMVESTIFARGKSYYHNNYVFDVKQNEENIVRARVKGSFANSYEIKLYKEGVELRAKCDCPYDGVCKHIVATLISINQVREIKESIVLRQQDKVLTYFESLSNVELIELLMEYAPENFKKEIILKDAPVEELNIRINEIVSSIKFDINDEDLLYNPEQFQEKMSEYMENLKIFVNKSPDEVLEIVFDLAVEIEDKQENGYLWVDHYQSEEYFDFDIFSDEIMVLINKIEDKEIQVRLFIGFGEVASGSSYLVFSYEQLEIEDKNVLLKHFDKNSSLSFYDFIKELLSFEENESFLLSYDLSRVYQELIYIYVENDKKELAIKIVEDLLKEKFNLDYVKQLLTLTEVSTKRFRAFIYQAIEQSSYGSFEFIVEGLKKVEKLEALELFWKEKHLSQYYEYLQKNRRTAEMFELLKHLPNNREKFFKKNKKVYQEEAIEFFNTQIENNLRTTGDNYYHAIASALSELNPLMEEDAFILKVEGLKRDYKRRRNFVAILHRRFG